MKFVEKSFLKKGDLMPEIGIVFDIDDLGGGMYGSEAFKIFYKNLDPSKMSDFIIYDGDTNSTLTGSDRHYCIAVKSNDSATIDYVENTMKNASDKGLAPLSKRFIRNVSAEPLVQSAVVTNSVITITGGGPPSWGLGEYEDKWTGKAKKEDIPKSDTVYCPSCGTQNESHAKFCHKCGGSLNPKKSEVEVVNAGNYSNPAKENSHKTAIVIGYILCIISSGIGIIFSIYLQSRENPKAVMHGRIQACIWSFWLIILGLMFNPIFLIIGIIVMIVMIYYLIRDKNNA